MTNAITARPPPLGPTLVTAGRRTAATRRAWRGRARTSAPVTRAPSPPARPRGPRTRRRAGTARTSPTPPWCDRRAAEPRLVISESVVSPPVSSPSCIIIIFVLSNCSKFLNVMMTLKVNKDGKHLIECFDDLSLYHVLWIYQRQVCRRREQSSSSNKSIDGENGVPVTKWLSSNQSRLVETIKK